MATDTLQGEDAGELGEDIGYTTLKAIVKAVAEASVNIIMDSFESAFQSDEVKANVKNGIMSYLYAAGFLSFAGREITKDSVFSVLNAVGIEPNPLLTDIMLRSGIKSHLVYAYAFYFLLINGKSTSEANILRVIDAIGLNPDKERVKEIMGLLV